MVWSMDKKINVSIIIPSYNVACYIRQCLDSVIGQTLSDLEIICVDAQSTDGTLAIIEEYLGKDERIRLILSDKKSYGYQMNLGLEAARGKYIGIVESDDWADRVMFEKLFFEAENRSVQIVKSNYYKYRAKKEEKSEYYEVLNNLPYQVVFNPEDFRSIFTVAPSIWTGIYNKTFLEENQIRFLESPGASFQDTGFIVKCLVCASKVMLLDEAFLHYRVDNDNSSVKSESKVQCICEEFKEVWRFLKERPSLYKKYGKDILAVQCERYCWNFHHLSAKYKYNFLNQMRNEFLAAKEQGLIEKEKYSRYNWKFLQMVLMDTKQTFDYFCAEPMVTVVILGHIEDRTRECLRSLETQTLKSIEIIHAREITDTTVIQKAKGKYLLFVDGCMRYQEDILERGVKRAFATEAELVIFNGYFQIDNLDKLDMDHDFLKKLPKIQEETVFSLKEEVKEGLSFTVPILGNRLYTKEYLMKLKDTEPDLFAGNLMKFRYLSLLYASKITCFYQKKICMHVIEEQDIKMAVIMLRRFKKLYAWMEKKTEFLQYQLSVCKSIIGTMALFLETICRDDVRMMVFQYFEKDLFVQNKVLGYKMDAYGNDKCWALRLKGIHKALQIRDDLEQLKDLKYEILNSKRGKKVTPKISVIVPVYNSEQYLRDCLDSIISQSLTEIEIICVDDGSTDDSLEILKEYMERDQRIMVVHQKNYKQSIARNIGVQLATGEYLYFIDSDDRIEQDALRCLYRQASNKQLDVLFFNAKVCGELQEEEFVKLCKDYKSYYTRTGCYPATYDGKDLFCRMQVNGDYLSSPCLQLIRRTHFLEHSLWFEPGIYHEDEIFGLKSIVTAKKAGYMVQDFYERRIRRNSTVSSKKVFYHVYGKWVCFQRITEILSTIGSEETVQKYGYEIASKMLSNARFHWNQIGESEQFAFYGLSAEIRNVFKAMVIDWCAERNRLVVTREWMHHEKKEKRRLGYELELLRIKNRKENMKDQKMKQEMEQKYQQNKKNLEQKYQQDKVCLRKTIKRLENKIADLVISHIRNLLYMADQTGKKTALWGCGKIGMEILEKMVQEQIRTDFLIDQDPMKKHIQIYYYTIHEFDEVKDQVDIVLVTSHKYFHSIQKMATGKMVIDLIG